MNSIDGIKGSGIPMADNLWIQYRDRQKKTEPRKLDCC